MKLAHSISDGLPEPVAGRSSSSKVQRPGILFVCTVPPVGRLGATQRTLQTASLLARRGRLTLVLASELMIDPVELSRARELFPGFQYFKLSRRRRRTVVGIIRSLLDARHLDVNPVVASEDDRLRMEQLVAEHDVTWIHTLKVANAFRRFEWPRTILDIDDVPSKWLALAADFERRFWKRGELRADAWFRRRSEAQLLERFDLIALCDPDDVRLFADPSKVHPIPNGFADEMLPARIWSASGSKRLGMIGAYNYLPNRDGVFWFLRNVWPQVRAQVHGAEFVLSGKDGEGIAALFPDMGVKALGFVEDLGREVATWTGTVVPTRMGGGTHVKVAEAMGMGLPIVATRHGCRGYTVSSGREVLLADEPTRFAEECVRLIRSTELQSRLSQAGRRYYENHLTWSAVRPAVDRALDVLLTGDSCPDGFGDGDCDSRFWGPVERLT